MNVVMQSRLEQLSSQWDKFWKSSPSGQRLGATTSERSHSSDLSRRRRSLESSFGFSSKDIVLASESVFRRPGTMDGISRLTKGKMRLDTRAFQKSSPKSPKPQTLFNRTAHSELDGIYGCFPTTPQARALPLYSCFCSFKVKDFLSCPRCREFAPKTPTSLDVASQDSVKELEEGCSNDDSLGTGKYRGVSPTNVMPPLGLLRKRRLRPIGDASGHCVLPPAVPPPIRRKRPTLGKVRSPTSRNKIVKLLKPEETWSKRGAVSNHSQVSFESTVVVIGETTLQLEGSQSGMSVLAKNISTRSKTKRLPESEQETDVLIPDSEARGSFLGGRVGTPQQTTSRSSLSDKVQVGPTSPNQSTSGLVVPVATVEPKERGVKEICADVFKRFQHDHELHKDDLLRAVELCGIQAPKEDWITLALAINECKHNSLGLEEFIPVVAYCFSCLEATYEKAFRECDADGSGSVEAEELAELLKGLGVEPMRHVLQEVMEECDTDGKGSLNLQEFSNLIDLIWQRECFTKREYDELLTIFGRFDLDGSGEIDSKELMMLLHFIGVNVTEEQADAIVSTVDVDGTGTISQREFFICMRKLRDVEIKTIKAAIEECDEDGSGTISGHEVVAMMNALDYVADPQSLKDAMTAVGLDEHSEMDISDFFSLLVCFREREGLCLDDIELIEVEVGRYCKDSSREVSNVDVGKVLRSLGFPTSYERQQRLVDRVDLEHRGTIGVSQLRKIVRMYYEEEVADCRARFLEASDGAEELPRDRVQDLLLNLQLHSGMQPVVELPPEDSMVHIGRFIQLVSNGLHVAHRSFRELGGFTKDQVKMLEEQFAYFDTDKSGDISSREMIKVIEAVFPDMSSDVILRPQILKILAEADENCNGVYEFREFLVMMRRFQDVDDTESARREMRTVQATGFDAQEVVEFRELFCEACSSHTSKLTIEELRALLSTVFPLGDRNFAELLKALSFVMRGTPSTRRSSMGARTSITPMIDPIERALIAFPDFLLLMRHLLDINFAGINDRSKERGSKEFET